MIFLWRSCMTFLWVDRLRDCVWRGCVIFSLTHSLRLRDFFAERLHNFFVERLHDFLCGELA